MGVNNSNERGARDPEKYIDDLLLSDFLLIFFPPCRPRSWPSQISKAYHCESLPNTSTLTIAHLIATTLLGSLTIK